MNRSVPSMIFIQKNAHVPMKIISIRFCCLRKFLLTFILLSKDSRTDYVAISSLKQSRILPFFGEYLKFSNTAYFDIDNQNIASIKSIRQ